jgi:hypothetical protein
VFSYVCYIIYEFAVLVVAGKRRGIVNALHLEDSAFAGKFLFAIRKSDLS